MMSPQLQQISAQCQEFFTKMGLAVQPELMFEQQDLLKINLRVAEPRLLIGQRGQTLLELQHLLRLLLRKLLPEHCHLELDVNDYKRKKINYLHELAQELAQEVAATKTEKELPPMPAFERRVIHEAITGNPNVITESIGEGENRRVVLKPQRQSV